MQKSIWLFFGIFCLFLALEVGALSKIQLTPHATRAMAMRRDASTSFKVRFIESIKGTPLNIQPKEFSVNEWAAYLTFTVAGACLLRSISVKQH